MGCCLSTYGADNTLYEYYKAKSDRRSAKRKLFSSISHGSSSGVFSAHSLPSHRCILKHCHSKSATTRQRKNRNSTLNKKTISKAFGMISICDEAVEMQQCQQNKSFGYYSESSSTEIELIELSQSCIPLTQDTRLCPEPLPEKTILASGTNLEMEMYMVAQSQDLMPKTSSPIAQRRDVSGIASASSNSYKKWAHYLQSTPTHMTHHVTKIPEAIAGHFSPLAFPAFTDVAGMKSDAKRFTTDVSVKEALADEVICPKQISESPKGRCAITTDV